MPSPTGPSLPPQATVDLDVRGTVPKGLSGRILGIGHDGAVHSVCVGADRAATLRTHQLRTSSVIHNVLAFGHSLLVFGDDSPAHELSADFGMFQVVDLAGHGRALAPAPKYDPVTGDLHVVAHAESGAQSHIIVSAGALTRRERLILDAPERISDLALTADHVVFFAGGFVGIAQRDGEARTAWIATGAYACHPVHAHQAGDTVVLLALTPSVERWTMHAAAGTVEREVLDPRPRRFAHLGGPGVDAASLLWTTGADTIGRHDLAKSQHVHHALRPHAPDDFVVVSDPARPDEAEGGWLVAFVHDASGTTTDLCVLEAARFTEPAVATIRIPRVVPRGLRCTWIPSSQR